MKNITVAFFFHDTNVYSGATMALLDLIDWYNENISQMKIIAIFPINYGTAIDYLKKKNVEVIYSHYTNIMIDVDEPVLKRIFLYPKRKYIYIRNKAWNKLIFSKRLKKYNIDLIYSNTSVIIGPLIVAQKLNIPIISHFREFGEEDYEITPWFGRKKFYKIAQNYSEIICISKSIYEKYIKYFDKSKLKIIYDDLSKDYLNYKEKNFLTEFNILVAGSISPGKGQLLVLKSLINILNKHKDINIYFAGSNINEEYYSAIEEYIKNNNLNEQVKYLGLVENMNKLRDKMHVGIVASEREGFGRVTIEGMLSGLIMIGRDSGGTSELIEDGKTGFLVSKNFTDLEDKLLYVYKNYDKLDSMREEAYNYATLFTQGRCAKDLFLEFEKMI